MESLELKQLIENDISKFLMPPRVLLTKFHMLDDAARETVVCSDPTYFPFYYHLGKYIKPKNIIQIGFGLGLVAGSFMSSCDTIEEFFGIHTPNETNYTWRTGRTNVLSVNPKLKSNFKIAVGDFKDYEHLVSKKWDLVLINDHMEYDKYRYILDVLWDSLNLDCFMIVDMIDTQSVCSKGFMDLCKIKNRECVVLKTLYGSGIIKR